MQLAQFYRYSWYFKALIFFSSFFLGGVGLFNLSEQRITIGDHLWFLLRIALSRLWYCFVNVKTFTLLLLFFSWAPHVHQLGWFVAKSSALFSHRSEVKRMFEHHWLVSVSWWSLCKHSLLLRSSLVVEVTLHHRYSHLFWEWTPISVIFSTCCWRSDFNSVFSFSFIFGLFSPLFYSTPCCSFVSVEWNKHFLKNKNKSSLETTITHSICICDTSLLC